jgi:16S rRNA (cytidine1402-2'-O)-methyltransferase
MAAVFGAQRPAALVRELSKLHEEVAGGTLQELADRVKESPRGECVIVVTGSPDPAAPDLERVLAALGDALPVAQAAGVAAKITGLPRKQIYARILERRKG